MTGRIIEAARAAGELLLRAAASGVSISEKGSGHELVTSADLASQELLGTLLGRIAPDACFMGEEGWDKTIPEGPCWIVDPLDGTNNYAHGYPVWSVSVAFSPGDGTISDACVFDPTRDEVFSASQGKGAFLNGKPIRATDAGALSSCIFATGFPYDRSLSSPGADLSVLDHFLRRVQGIRRGGSAALDLAYVASGRLDGFWEEHLKPWDMAAGVLLVTEAGGKATDYHGGCWSVASEGVAASGGRIHGELLNGISRGNGDT